MHAFTHGELFEKFAAYETAAIAYQRSDGTGPIVWLVGAVHIGDARYYESLQRFLDKVEVVLFESVLPHGAFGASATSEISGQRATQDVMLFLRGWLEQYALSTGKYPGSIAQLRAFVASQDDRLGASVDLACTDAWGRTLVYSADDEHYTLSSLGSDARIDGTGEALDLVLRERADLRLRNLAESIVRRAAEGVAEVSEYARVAKLIGVKTQTESLDYGKKDWIPADLSARTVLDRLAIKGVRDSGIENLLSDEPLYDSGFRRAFLAVLTVFVDVKREAIEALASEGAKAMERDGAPSAESVLESVILDERNCAALARLRSVLERASPPASIAILYGAAHMPDLAQRLQSDFGLSPIDDSVQWFRVMEVGERPLIELQERERSAIAELEKAQAWTVGSGSKPTPKRIAELRERVRHYRWRVAAAMRCQPAEAN